MPLTKSAEPEETERIQGTIPKRHREWVKQKIKEGVFASESHAVRRAISILIDYTEGRLLT